MGQATQEHQGVAPSATPSVAATAQPPRRVSGSHDPRVSARVLGEASRLIAKIDELIQTQLLAILHHSRFRQLEASWRGLAYLFVQAKDKPGVKIKVLNATWREVARDLESAIEFDQSSLFRKIYSQEFDQPGGEPFGLLIGDYEVAHKLGPAHTTDDMEALRQMAQIGAAAFAPFVCGASPELLGLDSFNELERVTDFERVFADLEYKRWNDLRSIDDARFIGLTTPHILLRTPYEDDGSRWVSRTLDEQPHTEGFAFRDPTEQADHPGYLWGSAAYAFASVVMQSFDNSAWFADIRGAQHDPNDGTTIAAGGVVHGLPAYRASPGEPETELNCFETDRPGLVPKMVTEVFINAYQEKALAEQGIMGLCHSRHTPLAVFYTCPSLHRPIVDQDSLATASAQLEAMLQNTLCAARFAHYVKIIGQRRIGSFRTPKELQNDLQEWVRPYVSAKAKLSEEERARTPLREARVRVTTDPGKPGSYLCVIQLKPQYQLEQLVAMITLETELRTTTTV